MGVKIIRPRLLFIALSLWAAAAARAEAPREGRLLFGAASNGIVYTALAPAVPVKGDLNESPVVARRWEFGQLLATSDFPPRRRWSVESFRRVTGSNVA